MNIKYHLHRIIYLATCSIALCACAVSEQAVSVNAKIAEARPGVLAGYLSKESLPNSLAILPSAPIKNSALELSDIQHNEKLIATRNEAQWMRAVKDAKLNYPDILEVFSVELGFKPNEMIHPNLVILLRRSMVDAGMSTLAAKQQYARVRPFLSSKQTICTPDESAALMKGGSYPSGHAAIGISWALILSEVMPPYRDILLQRGKEFGNNRVVCGVHWQSDVDMGRVMGEATFLALLQNAEFNAQLERAKQEVIKQLN